VRKEEGCLKISPIRERSEEIYQDVLCLSIILMIEYCAVQFSFFCGYGMVPNLSSPLLMSALEVTKQ
jgi:hypothetical protein